MIQKYSKTLIFFGILIIVIVVLSILQPSKFLSLNNLESMTFQIPELGILSLALMIAIISGGIDLSIVSISVLSAITAALIFSNLIPKSDNILYIYFIITVAILTASLCGLLCGILNGFIISIIGVSPILVTLGTSRLFEGISMVITKGNSISNFPKQFVFLGAGTIGLIPFPLIIFFTTALIVSLVLNKTKFGFTIYLVGSNPIATLFSGISNKILYLQIYLFVGLIPPNITTNKACNK